MYVLTRRPRDVVGRVTAVISGDPGIAVAILALIPGNDPTKLTEARGTIGAGGSVTLALPAPAGGWRSETTYYYQAYATDPAVYTSSPRGTFQTPRWGSEAPAGVDQTPEESRRPEQGRTSSAQRPGDVTPAASAPKEASGGLPKTGR